jgi:hydrogenase maturation protease
MNAGPSVAPTLVIAVGNLSRGDDAAGPMLAERLLAADLPGVEVLVEFQLQVEHALDLAGRKRVIFIDACVDALEPWVERPLRPARGMAHTSHSLAPAQVLDTRHWQSTAARGAARTAGARIRTRRRAVSHHGPGLRAGVAAAAATLQRRLTAPGTTPFGAKKSELNQAFGSGCAGRDRHR